ncbi:hypothetical protein C789_388 [Microcystis aeruginosa FACHB-905 = DIANCHI905]|nr:hypothetical protein C789_388 [Microcystis aeruginosa FACHB-905 = DIANCHI905]
MNQLSVIRRQETGDRRQETGDRRQETALTYSPHLLLPSPLSPIHNS